MIKLAVFDLDGTIALHDNPIFDYTEEHLKQIESAGVKLAFISAKPASYVTGFVRNIGLKDAIIGGENGTDLAFNLHYPVLHSETYNYSEIDLKNLEDFKLTIKKEFGEDIWIQPNQVTFCFFVRNKARNEAIKQRVEEFTTNNKSFSHYAYGEPAYEVYPTGINKKYGITKVMDFLNLHPSEVVVMGDGENDLPMLAEVEHSIGINQKAKHPVTSPLEGFKTIEELIKKYNK